MRCLIAAFLLCAVTAPPPPGIAVGNCRIDRVVDGDTVDIAITRIVRIRLRDCWAPESKRTKRHPSEKALGLIADKTLQGMAPVGAKCFLYVETDGDEDIGDGLTFSRPVGRLWIDGQDVDLSRRMNATGQTFEAKAGLESYLDVKDGEL